MSKCCLWGRKFKKKNAKGFGIISFENSHMYFVSRISNPDINKTYKFCPDCVGAVSFGASLENKKYKIAGFEPKYFKGKSK